MHAAGGGFSRLLIRFLYLIHSISPCSLMHSQIANVSIEREEMCEECQTDKMCSNTRYPEQNKEKH